MSLTLYKPKCGELWFKQKLLGDEETMSYNHAWGGTVPFPEEKWREWYDRWLGNSDGKRYYRYLKDASGAFVGEIAYHYDTETDAFLADVLIDAKQRGKGYGTEALRMLCAAAKENDIPVLCDTVAIDNPSIALFLKQGFTEEYRTAEYIMVKKVL